MTSPYSILEFDMDTKEQTLLKEQEVLGSLAKKITFQNVFGLPQMTGKKFLFLSCIIRTRL